MTGSGRSIEQLRRSIEQLSGARDRRDEDAGTDGDGDGPDDRAPSGAPAGRVSTQVRPPDPASRRGGPSAKQAGNAPPATPRPLDKSVRREAPEGRAPAVAMDPRFRRRRIDVRRDEGRKRLLILIGCLAVVLAAGAAAAAGRSPLFDVDYVDVRGADHTARQQVIEAGRLGDHPAMLDVASGRVVRQVEALPWVLHATVRRQWPGTVRVDVTERRAAAVLPGIGGQWALADRTGRILSIGTDKPTGLPVIGNIAPPERAGVLVPAPARPSLRVADALPDSVREQVADIATLDSGEVELQLVPPGGVVRLGLPVDLEAKLSVLETVLARADLARIKVVDVRVPRAPALTRR